MTPSQAGKAPLDSDMAIHQILLDKGYTPHVKPVPLSPDKEFWWEKPTSAQINWPTAAVLIALMAFIILIVRGVPW